MPAPFSQQLFWLFVLAIPVACVVRTAVYEEIFREPREWCVNKSKSCNKLIHRKFFYVFTCEYCFSHWVTLFFIYLTQFKLLLDDWRGYLIAFFAIVFVANAYLNLYARLRVDISQAKAQTRKTESEADVVAKEAREG